MSVLTDGKEQKEAKRVAVIWRHKNDIKKHKVLLFIVRVRDRRANTPHSFLFQLCFGLHHHLGLRVKQETDTRSKNERNRSDFWY